MSILRFLEGVVIALQAIWANKLRSFLTLIGIIIGVTTVIAVVSVINGMDNYVAVKINSMGSNTFIVDKEGIITSEDDYFKKRKRKRITIEDMKAVKRYCELCEDVGGIMGGRMMRVKYGSKYLEDIHVAGSTHNYIEISDVDLDYGRMLNETDDMRGSAVCVVGPDIVSHLLEDQQPVGKRLKIGRYYYTIIGVAKSRGSFLGVNQDNWIVVPLRTYSKYIERRSSVSVYVKAAYIENMQETQDQVRSILRARRKVSYSQEDDFDIMSAASVMSFYDNFVGGAWLVLIIISSISLLVGGIVIMNIMLVSVTERTREIGIRKAIGAKRKDILWQFLVEAVTLAILGGGIGVLIGIGFAAAIGSVSPLPADVELWSVLSGLGVASSVGLVFGIFPAMKAARLDPIDSLRYE
ncbi:MAG: ABC transporter permease [Candidatus Zixiibacteriota bacterium]|nr:MAG: ABC transporter permease [candidate division Zixibacteria bacterium]